MAIRKFGYRDGERTYHFRVPDHLSEIETANEMLAQYNDQRNCFENTLNMPVWGNHSRITNDWGLSVPPKITNFEVKAEQKAMDSFSRRKHLSEIQLKTQNGYEEHSASKIIYVNDCNNKLLHSSAFSISTKADIIFWLGIGFFTYFAHSAITSLF